MEREKKNKNKKPGDGLGFLGWKNKVQNKMVACINGWKVKRNAEVFFESFSRTSSFAAFPGNMICK